MKNKLILFIVAGLLLWGTSAFAGLAFLGGGHRQIASGTFTQANSRISLVDGTAFFDCGVDLSAYAGLDSGSHEYLIKVYDDDGNSIQGYVGAVGGGVGYSAEIIPAGTGDRNLNWSVDAASYGAFNTAYDWIAGSGFDTITVVGGNNTLSLADDGYGIKA